MADAEKTTLFRDLSFIVSCDDEDRVYQNASLLVCGNSIKCVAEETGSLFLDAAACTTTQTTDGLHLGADSHINLAEAIAKTVTRHFQ